MDIQWLMQKPQQMSESGKNLPTSLVLQAGDLLTASVLDVEKNNDALLSIGHLKAYARLPLPVVTGQDIQIHVEAAGKNLRLVMVPKSGPAPDVPAGERLPIHLFEPISGRPFLFSQAQNGVARQSADHQAQPEMISGRSAQPSVVPAGSSPSPTAPEMAALRAQIQRLLDGTIQPEKGLSTSLPTPMKGVLINLQQALSPVSAGDMAVLVARVRNFVENS